ncbi:conserved hypothetical protein [Desulfosarcina cetonica]|uniref:hypothetical protein n=1 Tax=Desulfosarcina cetonica TaxID=90730 RepID=UPI0006D184C8|nr:hypothetical protein [Desulfosarcina cetonica]VTR67505.1 conserved hypothetical protein [Desulfosarcina cetonica]
MLPWLQSNINFPLSGDVNQRIEPDWFFGSIGAEVGDGEIEREVFQKVASYGRQIGVLTDVLLSIIDQLDLDEGRIDALAALKTLHARVAEVKASKKERLQERARALLDKLEKSDAEAFKQLIDDYSARR